MSWKNLQVNWQHGRAGELELPAAQIVGDLTRHEEAVSDRKRMPAGSAHRWPLNKLAILRVRRDQATLSDTERQAFKNAVQLLVDDGTYDKLVRPRSDVAHNMLGSLGVKGLHRFLPWHRRYLWEFETWLERADRRLRPNEMSLALPYWSWSDPFPDWLVDFFPLGKSAAATAGAQGASSAPRRTLAQSSSKPTHADVNFIVQGFAEQLPAAGVSDFVKFTYGLEGWGQRPDGSRLPAHNQVHAWVGGAMSQLYAAPADPIFWLHMAQVDRLWSLWQADHSGIGPALVGEDQVLNPWLETVEDVRSPLALGYAYDL